MSLTFKKATKEQSKLRLALCGTAGTGKTYSALAIAAELVPGGRVALIDTERGSASLYADTFTFDTLNLETHSPDTYVDAIETAEREGYDVIVVDSLSHAWSGRDGALEQVNNAQKRSGSGNSFTAWRDITPKHNRLVDAIVACRTHIIATMRSKTEWVLEKDEKTGKNVPRRVGMEPIQRSGMEFEFTLVGDIDLSHTLVVTKSRCSALADAVIEKPGAQVARVLREWLGTGVAPVVAAPPPTRTSSLAGVDFVARELDKVFAEHLAGIAGAADLAELDRAATGPAKPPKGTPEYQLAVTAYKQRKEELSAGAA